MIRKLITLALLVTFSVTAVLAPATPALASVGLPVMQRGLEGPDANRRFADLIDQAVARDATGNAPIEGGTGGFSPRMVYETLRTFNPEAGFTSRSPGREDFAAMTEYIRSLQLVRLQRAQTLRNSRMLRSGTQYRLDLSWTRTLPAGTEVYADRNTGLPVLKKNCGNGLGQVTPPPPPAEDPCDYIVFPAREDDAAAAVAVLGEYTPDPRCEISVQGPGSGPNGRTFDPAGYQPLRPCTSLAPCDWRQVVQHYGQRLGQHGQFRVTPGWWVVRVPRSVSRNDQARVVLCLTKADGTSTLSMGVQRPDYYGSSSRIATIWYAQGEMPANYRQAGSNLWWRWPTQVAMLGG